MIGKATYRAASAMRGKQTGAKLCEGRFESSRQNPGSSDSTFRLSNNHMRPLLPSLGRVARGQCVSMSASKRVAMVQRHVFSTESSPSSSPNPQAEAAKAVESSVRPRVSPLLSVFQVFPFFPPRWSLARAVSKPWWPPSEPFWSPMLIGGPESAVPCVSSWWCRKLGKDCGRCC
jgi:hypothetical protein